MSVGRGVWYRKSRVTDYLRLDMKNLVRTTDMETEGIYTSYWGKNFLDCDASIGIDVCPPYRLRLHYTNTDRNGNKEKLEYYVRLDTTPCHFGG